MPPCAAPAWPARRRPDGTPTRGGRRGSRGCMVGSPSTAPRMAYAARPTAVAPAATMGGSHHELRTSPAVARPVPKPSEASDQGRQAEGGGEEQVGQRARRRTRSPPPGRAAQRSRPPPALSQHLSHAMGTLALPGFQFANRFARSGVWRFDAAWPIVYRSAIREVRILSPHVFHSAASPRTVRFPPAPGAEPSPDHPPLHNPAIVFHRHARGFQPQFAQQSEDRLALRRYRAARRSQRSRSARWLTPLFSTHYSQI